MTRILLFFLTVALSTSALAAGAGSGHSMGVGIILMTPSQDDVNTVIDEINSSESRAVNKLGTAYELPIYYQYRFSSSMFALQFRPSYFMQNASGSGYDTKMTGFTIFPMLRMYPLENNFIHFYMQTGIGYGRLKGTMSGPSGSVDWAGGAFGAMAGMGAEFCFTDSHCLTVEGNVRYLPIERNIASGVTGTPSGFDTVTDDHELENGNMDVKTTMSGIQGGLFYHMNF
jgi:hypothetical protein